MIFWILVGSVLLIAIATLTAFRYIIRKRGAQPLVENGVVLLEDELEFSRFPLPGRAKVKYRDVDSFEVVQLPKLVLSVLLFQYGISLLNRCTRLSLEFVVIGVVSQGSPRFILVTPKDPSAFVEQLRYHIQQSRTAPGPN